MHPITFVTGPPGAGKTTLSEGLVAGVEFGVHIPVDDMRLWVKSGLADSVPWTDESERQFQVAEEAAVAVARRYQAAGFLAVIDHCRNVARLDSLIAGHLADRPVRKVLLLPLLEANLRRNRDRTNKDFDPAILDDTIRFTNDMFRKSAAEGWIVIDNTAMPPEEALRLLQSRG